MRANIDGMVVEFEDARVLQADEGIEHAVEEHFKDVPSVIIVQKESPALMPWRVMDRRPLTPKQVTDYLIEQLAYDMNILAFELTTGIGIGQNNNGIRYYGISAIVQNSPGQRGSGAYIVAVDSRDYVAAYPTVPATKLSTC